MTEPIGKTVRLAPGLIEPLGSTLTPRLQPELEESGRPSFGDLLSNALGSVNGLQQEAAAMQEAFMNGDPVELHQVMIKAQEAGIAMDLLLEIRNKLLDAYNEVMRMPM